MDQYEYGETPHEVITDGFYAEAESGPNGSEWRGFDDGDILIILDALLKASVPVTRGAETTEPGVLRRQILRELGIEES